MEIALLIGAFVAIAGTFISSYTSQRNTDKANQVQKELQEDSQEFTHEERVQQNEWDKSIYDYQLSQGPLLQFQGYKNAGVSDAAAIQAIAGGSGIQMPTASNTGSGIGSAAQPNTFDQSFKGLAQAFNDLFQNENTRSNTAKNEADVVYTQKMCEQVDQNMSTSAQRLGLDQEYLQLAKDINYSQVGLYESERMLNLNKISEVNSNVQKNLASIRNLDAQTITEYVQQSKLVAETEFIQTSTAEKSANIELINAQTEGQNISNLDQNIVLTLRNARYEISKALGVDVDSDISSQILQAMAQGRFDTISKLLEIKDTDGNSVFNFVTRSYAQTRGVKHRTHKAIYNDYDHHFSPSFQPIWNPNSKSFRW